MIGDRLSIEGRDQRLVAFRAIITAKKEKEQKLLEQGISGSGHFMYVNPEELTGDDMNAYYAVHGANWSAEDFDAHRRIVSETGNKSSKHFATEYLAAYITLTLAKKELAELGIPDRNLDAVLTRFVNALAKRLPEEGSIDILKIKQKDKDLLSAALRQDPCFLELWTTAYRETATDQDRKLFVRIALEAWLTLQLEEERLITS